MDGTLAIGTARLQIECGVVVVLVGVLCGVHVDFQRLLRGVVVVGRGTVEEGERLVLLVFQTVAYEFLAVCREGLGTAEGIYHLEGFLRIVLIVAEHGHCECSYLKLVLELEFRHRLQFTEVLGKFGDLDGLGLRLRHVADALCGIGSRFCTPFGAVDLAGDAIDSLC